MQIKRHIIGNATQDLKLDKFRAEYKGQMELYLRYIEKYEMEKDENPPVGLLLCTEKGKEIT